MRSERTDQRLHDYWTAVWELATLQWGGPLGLLIAGVALIRASDAGPVPNGRAAVIVCIGVVVGMGVAHLVGRLLWVVRHGSRRGVG